MASEAISKRRRKRRGKKKKQIDVPFYAALPEKTLKNMAVKKEEEAGVEIEYVAEKEVEGLDQPEYEEYAKIFDYFAGEDEAEEGGEGGEEAEGEAKEEEAEEEEAPAKSKTQLRKERRSKIEVLKLLADKPEVVELHDANAADPWLLVYLKAYRNTVPVPRHWSQRRKYLAGKRGADKIPYELPEFIQNTGISTIRQAVLDKEEAATTKAASRERTQGKMGKIDIDYQILYDAFFRYQTKPKLTGHGQLYYEGREFEVDVEQRRPGVFSPKLRTALGMPEKGVQPPPWLVNMQRYGPPPAYPGLRIPGVNAPVPQGGVLGMHPGGWGRPPVDENNRPLYSTLAKDSQLVDQSLVVPAQTEHWGELTVMEEEEEDDDGDVVMDDEPEGEAYDAMAMEDDDVSSGIASVASTAGFQTPAALDLRKQKASSSSSGPQQLYQELVQEKTSVGNQMFGSTFKYVVPGAEKVAVRGARGDQVSVTLDPSELEAAADSGLSEEMIRKKYEEQKRVEKAASRREDFSDMVAADTARRKQREKKKDKKKEKFKF